MYTNEYKLAQLLAFIAVTCVMVLWNPHPLVSFCAGASSVLVIYWIFGETRYKK